MLDSKLKALKKDLKVWNQEVLGDIAFRKTTLLGELSSLDSLDEGGILDDARRERKLAVLGELNQVIELEEVHWR